MTKMLSGCLLVVLIALVSGCGGDGISIPPSAPVSGKVLLDGKPLDGAIIRFNFEGYSSTGKTKSDGTFRMPTGAAIGENKVVISKLEKGDIELNAEEGMDEGQLEAMASAVPEGAAKPKIGGELLPSEYSDPVKSILTFPVPADGTDAANFDLSS